jgi:hypothetical protein
MLFRLLSHKERRFFGVRTTPDQTPTSLSCPLLGLQRSAVPYTLDAQACVSSASRSVVGGYSGFRQMTALEERVQRALSEDVASKGRGGEQSGNANAQCRSPAARRRYSSILFDSRVTINVLAPKQIKANVRSAGTGRKAGSRSPLPASSTAFELSENRDRGRLSCPGNWQGSAFGGFQRDYLSDGMAPAKRRLPWKMHAGRSETVFHLRSYASGVVVP